MRFGAVAEVDFCETSETECWDDAAEYVLCSGMAMSSRIAFRTSLAARRH